MKFNGETMDSEEDEGASTSTVHASARAKHGRSDGKVCRLCANTAYEAIYIFGEEGTAWNLPNRINAFLPVSVKQNDTLPQHVCLNCVDKLKNAIELVHSSLKSEEKFTRGKKSIRLEEHHGSLKNEESTDTESSLLQKNSLPVSDEISYPVCTEDIKTEPMSLITCLDENTSIGDDSLNNHLSAQDESESNFDLYYTREYSVGENSSRLQIQDGMPELANYENDCETKRNNDGCNDITRQEGLPGKEIAESETSCNEIPTGSVDHGALTDSEKPTCVGCNDVDEIRLGSSHYKNQMPQSVGKVGGIEFISEEDWEKLLPQEYHFYQWPEPTTIQLKESPQISETTPLECLVNGEGLLDPNTPTNKNTSPQVKKLICDFCGSGFDEQNILLEHMLEKHASRTYRNFYKCRVCQEIFPEINDALMHYNTHPIREPNGIDEVQLAELYMCEYCESCFAMKSTLLQHYANHDGTSCYVCKDCKATFASYEQLLKHKTSGTFCSAGNSHTLSTCKLLLFKQYGSDFPNWNTIFNYRRNLQSSSVHASNLCNKDFEVDCNSKNQRKIHASAKGAKPFTCSNNGKVFVQQSILKRNHVQQSILKRNQRFHADVHPYSCGTCGETFYLKSLHDKHLSKHTGMKPHMCNECGKGFTHISALYTHRRVHKGEKPYVCDVCQKAFRRKQGCDNHRRRHTEEKPRLLLTHTDQHPYSCDICDKGFSSIRGLRRHNGVHTTEKPYGCEICGQHFAQKGNMMRHRRTQLAFAQDSGLAESL